MVIFVLFINKLFNKFIFSILLCEKSNSISVNFPKIKLFYIIGSFRKYRLSFRRLLENSSLSILKF